MSLLRRLLAAPWASTVRTRTSMVYPIWNNAACTSAVGSSVSNYLQQQQPLQTILARGFASKKHKNALRQTKGFRGRSKNCYRIAIRRLEKSWQYAYRDRKRKRRNAKRLWIARINAAVRQYQWNYSQFWPALQSTVVNSKLNRKVLSDMAATEPFAFKAIVETVQRATGIAKPAPVYDPESEEWDFDEDDYDEDDGYDSDYEEWKRLGEA